MSQALRKLIDGGLLMPLSARPLPQVIPPHFRMDLYCAYHQSQGHDTDRCAALRHAIQDLIDQGLVQLGQPSVTANPLPTYSTHAVPPPPGGIHFLDFAVDDDVIHMLSWDDLVPEPIVLDGSYEVDGITSSPYTPMPFRLIPDVAPMQLLPPRPMTHSRHTTQTPFILTPCEDQTDSHDIQYVIRGGRVVRQQPPAPARPLDGDAVMEEVRREDDEILRQLQSTQARISIWSLLASYTTHREALIRALSQIRVDTTTSPDGLIHMLTADRATCIVFSDDDLPLEGSNHTRHLYISVGCSGRHVPSVLLDNSSALNVCPLATAIALGFGPSDFAPSTQTVRAYDSTRREVLGTLTLDLLIGSITFSTLFQVLRIPTSFNLLLGRPWIHTAGAIPSSLHQKVKFIHEGRVITVQSIGEAYPSAEPVLEISHSDVDLLLTGFSFDAVQIVEVEDFCKDLVAMSFDSHSNTTVLDIMRCMSFLPGLGLGRRQHGLREFTSVMDHDSPFGLGYVPTEADFRYMERLRKERIMARLSFMPFDYPLRPYTMCLADYFVRASSPPLPLDGMIVGFTADQEEELRRLVHKIQLSDGAPGASKVVIPTPSSPDRFSVLTLCFPDEVDGYGVPFDPNDLIDGIVLPDEYHDEMLMMDMDQMVERVFPEPTPAFQLSELSEVFTIEQIEDVPLVLAPEVLVDVLFVLEDVVSPDVVESSTVDPPLSFDVLSGFISRFDDVLTLSSMDLRFFEYFSASCDNDIAPCSPSPPTSHVFDIDDKSLQCDLDVSYQSDSDHEITEERVSPTFGDPETIDLGTTNEPRELRICSALSAAERDSLFQLLRSYLDVFAWSYEDMPGLDPSIVQHHLPLVPHARPVKQKLRRLHPRWSLQVKEEIQKQLSVGFISVVEYPEWLVNVVPVPKKDGKVRVCVDFRNLNKASPKDDFPLPHIDMLVDSTAGHVMLSFMDGFSGYNQIMMAPEDREKTSFITEWGTYCYRVMPFGLKNASATYQRAATTLFHDMMHRDVEVYVDNMIVKSRDRADH